MRSCDHSLGKTKTTTYEMLLNSPNENSFPTSACPHQVSTFFRANRVIIVVMAQKKALQVSFVDQ